MFFFCFFLGGGGIDTFSKGDKFCDFLFASTDVKTFPKWGKLSMERICSIGTNSSLLMVPSHHGEGRQN